MTSTDDEQETGPGAQPAGNRVTAVLRAKYQGSFTQEVARGLGEIEFGDRIIVFGASLLLSVMPLVIILSAYAGHRIESDIAHHLGLSAQGARVIEGLFKTQIHTFDVGILIAMLLSLAGTIAVARSVQVIYERAFRQAHAVGWANLIRAVIWVAFVAAIVMGDSAVGRALRDDTSPVVMGLVEAAAFTLFFWWTIHFLLGGGESWRDVFRAALVTAVFWIGLGVFAAFYFSSTIVSDSRTYGTIGVAFTLVTWFIAMGAVLTLGAVIGAAWDRRRRGRLSKGQSERPSDAPPGGPIDLSLLHRGSRPG